MKKLHKKWIIPVLSLVAAACLATGTYAYFSHTSESGNQHISAEITDGGRVNVSSFEQLFSYSKAEAYNDPDKTSAVGKRMTLTLQNDITLLSDLIVTADCHIDLNAKKLYLAGILSRSPIPTRAVCDFQRRDRARRSFGFFRFVRRKCFRENLCRRSLCGRDF
ncbi:MAG: hypothetical protein ACLR3U_11505 [Christensenellaceae bacterium]